MRKKQRKWKNHHLLILFLGVFLLSFLLFSFLESRFLPPLQEISHMQCRALANQIIDEATTEILSDVTFPPLPFCCAARMGKATQPIRLWSIGFAPSSAGM